MGFASQDDWWWIGPGARSNTLDAGLTWTPVRIGQLAQPMAGSLVPLDSRHAWISAVVGGTASLFATSDGGAHWAAVALPSIRP